MLALPMVPKLSPITHGETAAAGRRGLWADDTLGERVPVLR